jgi:hypothetical protein
MTLERTGPGQCAIIPSRGPGLWGRIYNFNIDDGALKPEHRTWLNTHVVPMLEGGGAISLYGATSRTASNAHNRTLSESRVSAVLSHLNGMVQGNFATRRVVAEGEMRAMARGQPDETEDEWDRAVIILVTRQPTPPPMPTTPQPRVDRRPRVLRCVHREFSKISHEHDEPGSADTGGQAVVNILMDILQRRISDPNLNEIDRARRFGDMPHDWAVNRVNVIKSVRQQHHARGTVTIERIEMNYEWGRPVIHVMLHVATMVFISGTPMTPRHKVESFPRRQANCSPYLNPINLDSNHGILAADGQP